MVAHQRLQAGRSGQHAQGSLTKQGSTPRSFPWDQKEPDHKHKEPRRGQRYCKLGRGVPHHKAEIRSVTEADRSVGVVAVACPSKEQKRLSGGGSSLVVPSTGQAGRVSEACARASLTGWGGGWTDVPPQFPSTPRFHRSGKEGGRRVST